MCVTQLKDLGKQASLGSFPRISDPQIWTKKCYCLQHFKNLFFFYLILGNFFTSLFQFIYSPISYVHQQTLPREQMFALIPRQFCYWSTLNFVPCASNSSLLWFLIPLLMYSLEPWSFQVRSPILCCPPVMSLQNNELGLLYDNCCISCTSFLLFHKSPQI